MKFKLYLVRTGPSYPAPPFGGIAGDKERQLTLEGSQCCVLAAQILQELCPKVHAVFASPALRATETARIFREFGNSPVATVSEDLYPETLPEFERAFNKLGHDCLSAYRSEHPRGFDQVMEWVSVIGDFLCGELWKVEGEEVSIQVFGHGVALQALGYYLMGSGQPNEANAVIEETTLHPCDCLLITIETSASGQGSVLNSEYIPCPEMVSA